MFDSKKITLIKILCNEVHFTNYPKKKQSSSSHEITYTDHISYIDFTKWLKCKKATINSKNCNKYFLYALTVRLNHRKISKKLSRK